MKTKKITIISVFVLLLFTLSTSGQVFAQEQEPTCYQFGDAGSVATTRFGYLSKTVSFNSSGTAAHTQTHTLLTVHTA
jgi:hypothetical protein